MRVTLKNEQTEKTKTVKFGFSWLTFFFGGWVPLFRGQWFYFLVLGLVGMVIAILDVTLFLAIPVPFTFIYNIVFCFTINKNYAKVLLNKGYAPVSADDASVLKSSGLL